MTSERHPKTVGAAWDALIDVLDKEMICYRAGGQADEELRPVKGSMNYGQAVYDAVENMQESGRWTREQVLAVKQFAMWVAKAARC